jgi:nucleotide-binding universal stress UspA family protein
MTKVLVAIDGSPPSMRALAYVEQRRARGDKFDVVVAHSKPYRTVREEAKLIDTPDKLKNPFDLDDVKQAVQRLGATTTVLNDDPAPAIAAYVQSNQCDEIVMGTRGLGAVKGVLMGSVTLEVVRLATVPVTLVK